MPMRIPKSILSVSVMAAWLAVGGAQDLPRRIADLSPPTAETITPVKSLADLDGTLFFNGWDAAHGEELWRSDGTPAGTFRVADLVPGPGSSSPTELVAVDGILFFTAHDEETGWQLWRSEGTPAGTSRVARLGDGSFNGSPVNLIGAGGNVYFERAVQVRRGYASELWCSDGTGEGTREVPFAEDRPDLKFATALQNAQVLDDELFFVDDDSVVWGTNGTLEGTRRISSSAERAFDLQVANGILHFIGYDPGSRGVVRESDGTANGTRAARWWHDGLATLQPNRLRAEGNTLLVSATRYNDPQWYLVVSDGTAKGTAEAMRAKGVWDPLGVAPRMARCGNGIVYAGNSLQYGDEPWFSSGTAKGTRLFKNLVPDYHGSDPDGFTALGKRTLFIAKGENTGREIWVTAGPGRGLKLLADVRGGAEGSEPTELTVSRDKVFWVADDGEHGFQLWGSDGRLKEARRLTDLPSRPRAPTESIVTNGETLGRDGVFYFAAGDAVKESVLWSTDGTDEGTWKVTPPSINLAGTYPNQLRNAGDRILYSAWDGIEGNGAPADDVWMTDGSPEGTSVAFRVEYRDKRLGWRPRILGELGGVVLLEEQKFPESRGLWRFAGGGPPAVPVMPGDAPLGAPGELLYFSRYQYWTGFEPWITDGTSEGTRMLKDLTLSNSGSDPQWLGKVGGKMLFSAALPFTGRELLVTDGTTGGTALLKDLDGTDDSSTFGEGQEWNGQLLFMASDQQNGTGLWRSDGTLAGTIQVKRTGDPYYFQNFDGFGSHFVEIGGKLCFTCLSAEEGVELWVTDGTPEGTHLVHDIWPGQAGSKPQSLTVGGDRLYFSADDGRHGRELWRSDGTAEGTVMVQDIAPGWEGSFPKGLAATGGMLFFQAWTPDSEVEPYVIDNP